MRAFNPGNEIPSRSGWDDDGGLVDDSRLAASPKRTPLVVVSLRRSSASQSTHGLANRQYRYSAFR